MCGGIEGSAYAVGDPGSRRTPTSSMLPCWPKLARVPSTSRSSLVTRHQVCAGRGDGPGLTILLASEWRPRVTGAWLACGRAGRLEAALLESLETSRGTLAAPPLAIVALHGLGARAVPALQACLRRDLERQLGAAAFTAAVLERLGSGPAGVAVNDQERRAVDGMLAVARRLGAAEPESPVDVG
jgi:hypothetical protein